MLTTPKHPIARQSYGADLSLTGRLAAVNAEINRNAIERAQAEAVFKSVLAMIGAAILISALAIFSYPS